MSRHNHGLMHRVRARIAPTRDEIAEAVETATQTWDEPLDEVHDIPPITNAILALMANQPTVNEVKAQALEEFAAHIENTAQRDDVRLTEHAVNDAGGAHLAREQAQLIRDGK